MHLKLVDETTVEAAVSLPGLVLDMGRLFRGELQVDVDTRASRRTGGTWFGVSIAASEQRDMAVVKAGLGQWEVPLDEVFPAE